MQTNVPLAGRPSIVPSELKAIIHKKKQPEEKSFRKVLTTFVKERYSGHGLRKLMTNDSLPRKIIWLVIFLICVALACCHAAGVVVEYFHQPTYSKMKVDMSSRVTFPAVTICHQDPLDFARAYEDSDGPVEAMTLYETVTQVHWYLHGPENVCTTFSSSMQSLADSIPSGLHDVMKLTGWVSSPPNKGVDLFFNYKEVIHSCNFNGMICDEADFYQTTHYKYGKCYTFNSNLGSATERDTLKYGMANGLKLVLKQSLEGRKHTIAYPKGGFRISIHSPDVSPFPEDDGYDIASSEEVTNIGVTPKKFRRLNRKSKECAASEWDEEGIYSTVGCRAMCFDKIIREECDCTRLMGDFKPSGVDACDVTIQAHQTCLERELKKMQDTSLCSECHAPCTETVYETSVISAKRGRDVKMLELARRIRDQETCDDKVLDFEKFELMDVNVYLENIIMETHEEEFTETMSDMVLHIGAMLALFLGFSLVVVLEFLELIIDFCILCFCKGNRVDPDDDVVSEEVMIRYHGFPFAFSNMVAGQAKRTSQASVMSENIMKNIEVMSGKETKDPWGYF